MSATMTMTQTQTMVPLERTRSRSNSGSKGRRTRVHFEIEDATPEFYGSKWIDVLSLYSGSSSYEVAIAALCSLALFVAVGQGIFEGPQLGIVAVLFLASIVHWALMFFFSGPSSPKNDTRKLHSTSLQKVVAETDSALQRSLVSGNGTICFDGATWQCQYPRELYNSR
ncbi:hypothetical protein F5B22DRAFT_123324 [Xylaria bambusicola]|uniref:uncharacterized protein n=1 Tax=Xylaria bambusicola TaxID=326684 RepID=UPI002008A786|nr:uncharacterized protein F5B22DRAFT_123324 [Xylaria bambusicola]KAI0517391.1 hypothetical protein F5B22DRAFT_123324 [Xylaria bambusicola]